MLYGVSRITVTESSLLRQMMWSIPNDIPLRDHGPYAGPVSSSDRAVLSADEIE